MHGIAGFMALSGALLLQSVPGASGQGALNDLASLLSFPSQPAMDEQGNNVGTYIFIPQVTAPCVLRINIMLADKSGRQQLVQQQDINWAGVIGYSPDAAAGQVDFKVAGGGGFVIGAPAVNHAKIARIAPVLIGACNPSSGVRDPMQASLTEACPGSASEAEAVLSKGIARDQTRYYASTVPIMFGGDRPSAISYSTGGDGLRVKTLTLDLPRDVSAYAPAARSKYRGWTNDRYPDVCKSGQTCVFEVGNEQGQPSGAFLSADLKPSGRGATLACRYRG